MLTATLLALTSAVLHAGWNLAAKQSSDRFLALWGQFFVGAAISAAILLAGGVPAAAWAWAAITGAVHIPYTWGLARAYDRGDFSIVYPVARGSGALLSAVGGIVFLDDRLSFWPIVAIVGVAGGICLLANGRTKGLGVIPAALLVGVMIGIYTTSDSHANRTLDSDFYPFAVFVMIGLTTTCLGLALGRGREMLPALRTDWRRFAFTGPATVVTYWLILIAVKSAPVGYVAALRESSVLIASLIGTRLLAEQHAGRRTLAASLIVSGLVLLVATG